MCGHKTLKEKLGNRTDHFPPHEEYVGSGQAADAIAPERVLLLHRRAGSMVEGLAVEAHQAGWRPNMQHDKPSEVIDDDQEERKRSMSMRVRMKVSFVGDTLECMFYSFALGVQRRGAEEEAG